MFLQSDPSFPKAINLWGCYFFSLLCLTESRRNRAFGKDEIQAIYVSAQASGILQKEVHDARGNLVDGCTVLDPVALVNLAGGRVSTITVADANKSAPSGSMEVLIYHRPADWPKGMGNGEHTHFVAGDGHGKVLFDPLGTSNTVKYGYVTGKRFLS